MTRDGALAGMLTGAITVIVWKEFFAATTGLYEMVCNENMGDLPATGTKGRNYDGSMTIVSWRPSPAALL